MAFLLSFNLYAQPGAQPPVEYTGRVLYFGPDKALVGLKPAASSQARDVEVERFLPTTLVKEAGLGTGDSFRLREQSVLGLPPFIIDPLFDARQVTALFEAIDGQQFPAVQQMLTAKPALIKATAGRLKNTPLHMAVVANNVDMAKLLLRFGADVKALNAQGASPVLWATYKGSGEMVETLCAAGADIDAGDEKAVTPLAFSVLNGNAPMTDLLLRLGANPDQPACQPPDASKKLSPFELAYRGGKRPIIDLLYAAELERSRVSPVGQPSKLSKPAPNRYAALSAAAPG